jgi:acetyltransferase-like isoleucine patch superfamily enzyme
MHKPPEFMLQFKSVDTDVTVFQFALILKPEMVSLGSGVRIDDFSRIEGGSGLSLGKYVHVCSFASIFGGGSACIGDFCGISQGARLITGTEQPTGIMTAAAPRSVRDVKWGHIDMQSNSFVGANAVIMPNVSIGEGAVIAAGAVVTKSVMPWAIMAGVPARMIGKRKPVRIGGAA